MSTKGEFISCLALCFACRLTICQIRAYVTTADWQVPLTARGRQQGRMAGKKVMELVNNSSTGRICKFCSGVKEAIVHDIH